jgi:NADPH-dependent glutamate synthase beta subunit-like oxidoreductase/ferredoxin
MIRLKIDQKEIEVAEGTTVLEAARLAGIAVPSMCHVNGYGNHPSCMVCLVKDNKSGAMIPSCSLRAVDGMDISSDDSDVLNARRQSLELLFSDHVGDCEAPCSLACPAGMNIPLMNRLLAEGRFTDALNVVKEEIALPYILGYICPAPCEKACRRKQVDNPVSVCLLKRFSAASGTDSHLSSGRKTSGKKVAIIGGGLAGMAAAYYLQIYGHSCTIFDKNPKPGGTLRTAVSEEIMPHSVIDQETEILKSMGVAFSCNVLVDEAFYNTEIKPEYDAVILATGDINTAIHLGQAIALSKSGFQTDEKNMSASVPGVFVCGSAIRPNKMAVRSVAQGKTAAESVHYFLQNKTYEKLSRMFNSRFDKLFPEEYPEYLKEAIVVNRENPSSGLIQGFTKEEAIQEARRCLHCDCRKLDSCKLRTYAHAYNIDRKRYQILERRLMTKEMQHPQLVFEREKCIKCGICVEVSAQHGEKYGLAFEGRGFDVFINVPLGVSFQQGLPYAAEKCALLCPTGAISIKQKE